MVPMRRLLSALLLTLAFTSTGCLRATTTIELKPDGSGTVFQETAMTTQALTMLKSIGSQAQQGGGDSPTDIFSEEQAKKAAATMGVTFVSGEPSGLTSFFLALPCRSRTQILSKVLRRCQRIPRKVGLSR